MNPARLRTRWAPSLFGDFTDPKLLDKMARHCEVVTVDWENVPAASLQRLATRTRVAPPVLALATAQDRLLEKILFTKLGIPTNSSVAVDSLADLHQAAATIGLPGVLKTRRMGYDGKGQYVLRDAADIELAWQALGTQSLLYEEFVPFDYEVSAIGVRGPGWRNGHVSAQPQPASRRHPAPDARAVEIRQAGGGGAPAHVPGAAAFRLLRCAGHRILRPPRTAGGQ